MIACPVAAFYFLFIRNNLNDSTLVSFRNLHSDVAHFRGRLGRYYSVVFAVRRIVFIAIPVLFDEPLLQIMIFMVFHTCYLMAYVGTNPHTDFKRTCVEVLNEVALMMTMYHLAGWSGMIGDNQMQFDTGYSFVTLVLITMSANLYAIVSKAIENWRHRRAVELNRLLVLQSVSNLEAEHQAKIDKKDQKTKIRDDFIMKRMLEADPKIQTEVSAIKKTPKMKKLKSLEKISELSDSQVSDNILPPIQSRKSLHIIEHLDESETFEKHSSQQNLTVV